MGKIPNFNAQGLWPPADYEVTFEELKSSILVEGPRSDKPTNWDSEWRLKLVENCETLVNQLTQIGITKIFLDGSFVEEKDHPNDIDGYFECDFAEFVSGQVARELNKIDKHKVWTWDKNARRAYRGYVKKAIAYVAYLSGRIISSLWQFLWNC